MLLSLAMVISCLFAFTACGGKKDDDSSNQTPAAPTVESLLVEVVTDGLTMTENSQQTIVMKQQRLFHLSRIQMKMVTHLFQPCQVELQQLQEVINSHSLILKRKQKLM